MIIKYILLGLIQGITEILPISSSAHLIIMKNILNINDDGLFLEIFLHLGSLVAICFFMRKRLCKLIIGTFSYVFKKKERTIQNRSEFKIFISLVISTIPIVLFTIVFGEIVDKVFLNVRLIGLLLIVNSVVIYLFSKKDNYKTTNNIKYSDAFTIGLFQCLGVFPGISRSGSCLLGTKCCNIDKKKGAEYAFLMFIPVSIGAFVKSLIDLDSAFLSTNFQLVIVSVIICIPACYLSLKYLLCIIEKGKTIYFSIYSILIGLITFLFV